MRRSAAVVAAGTLLIAIAIVVSGSQNALAARSGDELAARAWIREHGADAFSVAGSLSNVQLAIGQLRQSVAQAHINQLESVAQAAREWIEVVRAHFLHSAGGTLGDAERNVRLGANDLEYAMANIVVYADHPKPAGLTQLLTRFKSASAVWDSGVRAIWHIAHRSRPPIV